MVAGGHLKDPSQSRVVYVDLTWYLLDSRLIMEGRARLRRESQESSRVYRDDLRGRVRVEILQRITEEIR